MKDDSVRELALSLPDVVMAGRAKSTTSKYQRAWSNWLDWCEDKEEITAFPANPFYVAIYLNFVLKTSKKSGTLTTAFYGIRWGHHVNGLYSPTDHPFVSMTYEGTLRLCERKPKDPKEPITPEILKHLIKTFDSESLMSLRFLLICSLGFFGFFRIDELLTVQLKDLTIKSAHLEIFLEVSKSDQHRDGNTIYVSRNENTKFCPVNLVERFLSLSNVTSTSNPECFLIPRLIKIKKGHKIHLFEGISYTRAREIFKEKMEEAEIKGNFGLHSLRSGGASAAAQNNVNERLISKHGRWASDRARNSYIKDSIEYRLTISRKLGI